MNMYRSLAIALLSTAAGAAEPVLPGSATVFATQEIALEGSALLAELASLPDDQVHDAYDQDRDRVWVRIAATFTHASGETLVVPAFAMRDRPLGPWLWRLRWSPTRIGTWTAVLAVEAKIAAVAVATTASAALGTTLASDGGLEGPLLPAAAGERLLRQRRADGTSRPCWTFGACRAWNVNSDPASPGWSAVEGIDRPGWLLPGLRSSGFDLLNQWMAPWEYLLAHRDRAEHWRGANGSWVRHQLAAGAAWSAWTAFDQGRAYDFDALVASCAGAPGQPTVRMLLSAVPHQALQMRSHSWGSSESGWSSEDDGGRQAQAKLNGFSAFRPAMPAWDWFLADPRQPADDWRARLFDAQANLQRYLVARWGASRALGVWVLIDELDAVGDELGQIDRGSGWWAHPQCDRWLADQVRLWRGTLRRGDGTVYLGDPWCHPLHAATTSMSATVGPGANLAWDGGPPDARVDLIGWHWYPRWAEGSTYQEVWESTVDGVMAFAAQPAAARLISEFGAPDRARPGDQPSLLYPTLYHVGIWASLLAGNAGTAMDWDDGKEFGELRWRPEPGAFDRDHYPVDNAVQLVALRRFLVGIDPATLRPALPPSPLTAVLRTPGRVVALAQAAEAVHGWVLSRGSEARIAVQGLAPGTYRCVWIDPWSGDEILRTAHVVGADGALELDGSAALGALAPKLGFPRHSRLDRGRDVAFHLCRDGQAP